MASPNSIFTELVTTTFRKHGKEIKDNVSKNNALLRRMMDKGMMEKIDGGLSIVCMLDYANNSTYQRYSGYDVLNIGASEVISAAEYQWRQIAINVVASGLELRTNSGDSRIISLAKSRMKNAIRTFKNNFSADVYGDGTLPNQIGGLQSLVSDTGGGTVGGIDSAVWPFWRNLVQSAAAPIQGGGAITPGPTTMESLMLPLWLALTRGDDVSQLLIADNNYFAFYEQSQTSLKRYTNDGGKAGNAAGGFTSLKYKAADVIFDGGSGIPANHMYFLNDDYLGVTVHKDADMAIMDEMKPFNQDAAIIPVLWMGNMTCSNRSLQGVLKA
jgi:hypothetical protein